MPFTGQGPATPSNASGDRAAQWHNQRATLPPQTTGEAADHNEIGIEPPKRSSIAALPPHQGEKGFIADHQCMAIEHRRERHGSRAACGVVGIANPRHRTLKPRVVQRAGMLPRERQWRLQPDASQHCRPDGSRRNREQAVHLPQQRRHHAQPR